MGTAGLPFKEPYLDTLAAQYGAGLHIVDFRGALEKAREAINAWVAEETEERVKEIAPPGSVSANTRLILANAIYFKAGWHHPFKASDTADGAFTLLDGGRPSHLVEEGAYDMPDDAWDVILVGRTAYVADWGAGLHILDVSDPARPCELGFYDTPDYTAGVVVTGGFAFLADEGGGLRVVDVSDPTNPRELASHKTASGAEHLAIAGRMAYIADGYGGLVLCYLLQDR